MKGLRRLFQYVPTPAVTIRSASSSRGADRSPGLSMDRRWRAVREGRIVTL
jgi:hypothetical protein